MSNPARLEATVSDLRKRMTEAGCVFEFTVIPLLDGATIGESDHPYFEFIDVPLLDGTTIGESDHRFALELLFRKLSQQFRQQRLDLIARGPKNAALKFFTLEFDTSLAMATPVSTLEVSADGSSWLTWLGRAFTNPPYGSRADAALFGEFCAVVGLTSDAVVLDWVGNPNLEPERSDWSNYFDAGKEWWGIWCATIWNTATQTLAVIAASSTD